MKRKRTASPWFILILILGLVIAPLFAGCGGDEADEEQMENDMTKEEILENGAQSQIPSAKYLLVFRQDDFYVVDISTPAKPKAIFQFETDGETHPEEIFVHENHLYIDGGVFDLADGVPKKVGDDLWEDIFSLDGNRGYIDDYGLKEEERIAGREVVGVFDLDNRAAEPTIIEIDKIIGKDGNTFRYIHLLVDNGILYNVVVKRTSNAPEDENSQFVVVDVNNPQSPKLLSTLALDGENSDVETSQRVVKMGIVIYLPSEWGVRRSTLIDVSDPKNPEVVRETDEFDDFNTMYVDGDYLYAAAREKGLLIYDITNPPLPILLPRLEGSVPEPADGQLRSQFVVADGNYAYVGVDKRGEDGTSVAVIDVTQKDAPKHIVTVDLSVESYVHHLALIK